MLSDLVTGRVTAQIGNAASNAGGKLLKAVELEQKYGVPATPGVRNRVLRLAPPLPSVKSA